jgi:sarcosine oxidase, subunit alpha
VSEGTFGFEGTPVTFEDGDTVASALYRHGVRTFTRSLKYHRRRGLYCGTGDCPNCLITVDGVPAVRSCTTPAGDGLQVEREDGWPSTEFDLVSVTDRMHALMPVGFYYKTFVRPRPLWEIAEKVIRRATGLGRLPQGGPRAVIDARHEHPDVLVVGAGIAGLAAAVEAAAHGDSVLLADESSIGAAVAPGRTLDRIRALETEARGVEGITILEGHAAIGLYEGPMIALVADGAVVQVHPERVVVATGAAEAHGVFDGNDVPGVWLGRGAARLAGVHHISPGDRAVVVVTSDEGLEHLRTVREAGARVIAVVSASLADRVPAGVQSVIGATVERAEGNKKLTSVVIRDGGGERRIACDALVLSLGLAPRDGLLRMATATEPVVAAGDVLVPGCTPEEAEASGRAAARREVGQRPGDAAVRAAAPAPEAPRADHGLICLCEDVGVTDLEQAWDEGYRSSEILKRYTTATMGPCQGAMCGRHLAAFCAARAPEADTSRASARTTARPPVRPATLETLAATVHEVISKHTGLHEVHLAQGATMGWSGSWQRPFSYGDWQAEYRAVRERVSLMDVGSLGKFLVRGRDAERLIDHVAPCRVDDLAPGRSRYLLALGEAGYVADDGIVCRLDDGFYVTSTSGGAARMDAGLRDWADRLELRTHIVDQTAQLGAIVVAGPHARDVLSSVCGSGELSSDAFPYLGHREVTIAGVPCRAIRVGFVGELAFELHHPRRQGAALWHALMQAGVPFDLIPHGLDALELLRLEKGHLYLGQDTLPDDTPAKLGMSWAVAMDKPSFVGKVALQRMAALPLERKLVGLRFDRAGGEVADLRGMPLASAGAVVGRVTSAERSPAVGADIGLGWIRALDGEFPSELDANGATASVVPKPFYDPEGVRLRG